jgi:hypothetical protein
MNCRPVDKARRRSGVATRSSADERASEALAAMAEQGVAGTLTNIARLTAEAIMLIAPRCFLKAVVLSALADPLFFRPPAALLSRPPNVRGDPGKGCGEALRAVP